MSARHFMNPRQMIEDSLRIAQRHVERGDDLYGAVIIQEHDDTIILTLQSGTLLRITVERVSLAVAAASAPSGGGGESHDAHTTPVAD